MWHGQSECTEREFSAPCSGANVSEGGLGNPTSGGHNATRTQPLISRTMMQPRTRARSESIAFPSPALLKAPSQARSSGSTPSRGSAHSPSLPRPVLWFPAALPSPLVRSSYPWTSQDSWFYDCRTPAWYYPWTAGLPQLGTTLNRLVGRLRVSAEVEARASKPTPGIESRCDYDWILPTIAQMGSYTHKPTPNTPFTHTSPPQTPLFLAWTWKWAKWIIVWAIWTPAGQNVWIVGKTQCGAWALETLLRLAQIWHQ